MTIEFPTEDNHFQARFNPWIGIALILIGLLLSGLTIQTILTTGTFSFRIVIGILLIAIGALYFKRPYFAIAPNRLTIYSFFGQIVKRYPFADFHSIEIDRGKLYIRAAAIQDQPPFPAEARELVKIKQWMTKSSDWKRLKSIIKA